MGPPAGQRARTARAPSRAAGLAGPLPGLSAVRAPIETDIVKVVLLVLDAQPHRHVSAEVTPVLAGLVAEGGAAPSGGRAVLTSATYPNHASFATGTDAVGHGLYANHVVRDGRVRRAYDVGPSAPTLFDACRDARRTAVAV